MKTSARNFKNSAIKFLPQAAFVLKLLRRNPDASCDEILKFRSGILNREQCVSQQTP
ncbi:hypothetical protein [uncultured Campylobacter sp.]|uniref:hypothetical protein n=1 Tax=uncultured Campylobacter sp. TaxID=218934 RepID=UPI0015AE1B07|nr:hypothetical protein [uncultured Campylobacter sp.]